MGDLEREDLREKLERLVAPVRQDTQVSQGSARQQCVWLHPRTPRQDYRRRERSKDPVFRDSTLTSSVQNTWEDGRSKESERELENSSPLDNKKTKRRGQ